MNGYLDTSKICVHCMSVLPKSYAICSHCGADNAAVSNKRHQLAVRCILSGKYMVGDVLGQGGFGITYRGLDLALNVKIAIKEYYPEGCVYRLQTGHPTVLSVSDDMQHYFSRGRDRFLQEAQLLARMSELENIVSVRDYFVENGTAYIVMEYVEGKTLKQLMAQRGGKIPAQEALSLLKPIIRALAQVHRGHVVHRDISPDNIMLRGDSTPVLLDFGAAREVQPDVTLSVNVKHGYAPIEQYDSHGEQGPWTDVYAMCATLYKLTTGITPVQSLQRMLNSEPLPPPNEQGADFDSKLQQVVMDGLSVYSTDRIRDMETLYEKLYHEAISFQELPKSPLPLPVIEEERDQKELLPSQKPPKHAYKLLLLLLACLCFGLAGFYLGWSGAPQQAPSPQETVSASPAQEPTAPPATAQASLPATPAPTATPAASPSPAPTSGVPTSASPRETAAATASLLPSASPAFSSAPTDGAAIAPTASPTSSPSSGPSPSKTPSPTAAPSATPSPSPTAAPSPTPEKKRNETYSYQLEADGTVTLLAYLGEKTSLTCPDRIEGKTVAQVSGSFAADSPNAANIQTVALPGEVTRIGDGAFAQMEKLKTIKGGNRLVDVDASAFYGTPWLDQLRRKASDGFVMAFNGVLLEYTGYLSGLTISNVRVYSTTAFIGNSNLVKLEIFNNRIQAKEIVFGEGAFNGCSNLCDLDFYTYIPVRFLGPSFDNCPHFGGITLTSLFRDLTAAGILPGLAGRQQRSLHAPQELLEGLTPPNNVTFYPYTNSDDGLWYYGQQMLYWELSDESLGVVVFGYLGNETDVVIPDTLGGKPVRALSNEFGETSNTPHASGIRTLSLPSTLENIYGLNNMPKLTDVSVRGTPKKLYGIHWINETQWYKRARAQAQKNHEVLVLLGCAMESFLTTKDIVLPEGTRYDGGLFFQNLDKPKSVFLPSSFEFANLAGCDTLESVTMLQPTDYLNTAFEGCTRLRSVDLTLTRWATVRYGAFRNCISLEAFPELPKATIIEDEAFLNCSSLTELHFGGDLRSIGIRAFGGCSKVESLVFDTPNSMDVCQIEQEAFAGLTALQAVTLPRFATVKQNAFAGCAALSEVVLSRGVTLEAGAFSGCSGITKITLEKGVRLSSRFQDAFPDCTQPLLLVCYQGAIEEASLPPNVLLKYQD